MNPRGSLGDILDYVVAHTACEGLPTSVLGQDHSLESWVTDDSSSRSDGQRFTKSTLSTNLSSSYLTRTSHHTDQSINQSIQRSLCWNHTDVLSTWSIKQDTVFTISNPPLCHPEPTQYRIPSSLKRRRSSESDSCHSDHDLSLAQPDLTHLLALNVT